MSCQASIEKFPIIIEWVTTVWNVLDDDGNRMWTNSEAACELRGMSRAMMQFGHYEAEAELGWLREVAEVRQ